MTPRQDRRVYTPEEVAEMFGETRRWVYRHAEHRGFLAPYARRFGRQLYFMREGIDLLTGHHSPPRD